MILLRHNKFGRIASEQRVRLIIFDLDGTLVDAYAAVMSSVNFTIGQFGFSALSAYQIKRAVGWGDRHLMVQFVGEKLADQALRVYRRHHLKALKIGVRFLPGAWDLLRWCKRRGFLLAIASNRPTQFTGAILQTLHIKKYFDKILCADKLKKAKPHPAILLRICRSLKVGKPQALYVGDMTIDIDCGRRAGIKTIAVATGSNTKKELNQLKPYKIINRIDQLKEILTKDL